MTTQTYHVNGMTCGGCVRHVEKALRATPGVAEVQVDLAAATATVTGEADFQTLSARLAEAGYQMVAPA